MLVICKPIFIIYIEDRGEWGTPKSISGKKIFKSLTFVIKIWSFIYMSIGFIGKIITLCIATFKVMERILMFTFTCLLIKCAHYKIYTRYNDTKCDNFTHLLFTKNVSMIIGNIRIIFSSTKLCNVVNFSIFLFFTQYFMLLII